MSGDYTKNTSKDKVEIYYIMSNLNIVNVPFLCTGERDGKGDTSACHYESMTEQTNTNTLLFLLSFCFHILLWLLDFICFTVCILCIFILIYISHIN